MKKTMIMGIAAVFAAVVNASPMNVTVTDTTNGKKVTTTNVVDAVEYFQKIADRRIAEAANWQRLDQVPYINCVTNAEDKAKVDDILSKAKIFCNISSVNYPKCVENWFVYAGAYGEGLKPTLDYIKENMKTPRATSTYHLVNCYISLVNTHAFDVNTVLRIAPQMIKYQIRSEGKSFVKRGDINPVQVRLDKICAALNKPKCEGLDAAFVECGMNIGMKWEEKMMSDELVSKVRESVIMGEREFYGHSQMLRIHLGVEEYNKFVQEYNGQE